MPSPTFGARLRHLREAAGLSQSELADLAGVHRVALARYEADRVEPLFSAVLRIADALGVSVAELAYTPPSE